jgi:hypothetical protein
MKAPMGITIGGMAAGAGWRGIFFKFFSKNP